MDVYTVSWRGNSPLLWMRLGQYREGVAIILKKEKWKKKRQAHNPYIVLGLGGMTVYTVQR